MPLLKRRRGLWKPKGLLQNLCLTRLAPDCLQRQLRSRFPPRLRPGVGQTNNGVECDG
jgi:hypothetical protein